MQQQKPLALPNGRLNLSQQQLLKVQGNKQAGVLNKNQINFASDKTGSMNNSSIQVLSNYHTVKSPDSNTKQAEEYSNPLGSTVIRRQFVENIGPGDEAQPDFARDDDSENLCDGNQLMMNAAAPSHHQ